MLRRYETGESCTAEWHSDHMTAVLSVVSALSDTEITPHVHAPEAARDVSLADSERACDSMMMNIKAETMRGSTNMSLLNGFGTYR
jgi:hypothetical protein